MNDRKLILVALREGGENGGPFVSHKRIMESELRDKYDFQPLMVPRARKLINPLGMFKFVRTIKKFKPSVVHIAGLQLEGFLSLLACKLSGSKTILAIHGSSKEALSIKGVKRKIYEAMEVYTVKHADIVYGVSDYVSRWDICKYAKQYYGTIYNITDFDSKPQTSIRDTMEFSKEDVVIVSTGRIITEKGYDVLWDTIKRIGKCQHVKYVIAGEGAYKEEFERLVKEEGFEQQVFLIGYQSDIASVLNGADIFVICTKHETLCISLLEAANAKLPLVATNVGGIPEIIEDGENGYLVDNLDVDGFAQKLKMLIENAELRVQLGESAYKKIGTKFSKESIINKLDKVYEYTLLR